MEIQLDHIPSSVHQSVSLASTQVADRRNGTLLTFRIEHDVIDFWPAKPGD